MLSAFKKIGTGIAAAFAIDKVIDFGKKLVNAAAEVSAEVSAFDQIMGDYADEASAKVGKIADATGMVDSRLTPYMTSMTAKFKGLGYDIDDATDLASDGLTLAADAAAFWDKSLEDSMSGLNSFINGSYEGGEAIGLFANDTQLASYAVKQGIVSETKEWANLDEAKKQATRLEYAQDMFAMSGATGQAAKEANQYANVQANLNEKWRQFKAQIGEPLLQNIVLPAMSLLSGLIDKVTAAYEKLEPKLQTAKDKLTELGQYASETFKPAFDKLKEAFDKVKTALQPLIDKVKEWFDNAKDPDGTMNTLKSVIDGVAGGIENLANFISTSVDKLKEFKQWCDDNKTALELIAVAVGTLTAAIVAYNIAQAIKNAGGIVEIAQLAATAIGVGALTVAETAHSVASTVAAAATTAFGAAVSFLTSPITLVILAIGALIAIIVLVVKNWDTIKEKAKEVWDKIVEIWGTVKEWFTEHVVTPISEAFQRVKDTVTGKIEELKSKISEVIDNVRNKFNTIVDFFKNNWKELLLLIVNPFAGAFALLYKNNDEFRAKVDELKNKVVEIFNNLKDKVIGTFQNLKTGAQQKFNEIKDKITYPIEWLKANVPAKIRELKDNFINKIVELRSKAAEIFNNIKEKLTQPIENAKNTIKKIVDTIKGFFSNLKLKFPNIKLPHFSIKPSGWKIGDLLQGSIPKLSIDWYAKAMDNGMILDKPTIFGMNGNGQLMGAGEAGSETIVGTGSLLEMINGAVRNETNALNAQFERLISMLAAFFPEILKRSAKGIYLDRDTLVGELAPEMDTALGNRTRLKARGQ